MNLTFAIDEKVAERARMAARAMGKSLNQVVREYLEQLAGMAALEAEIEEFRKTSGRGDSGGRKFSRTETYRPRVGGARGA